MKAKKFIVAMTAFALLFLCAAPAYAADSDFVPVDVYLDNKLVDFTDANGQKVSAQIPKKFNYAYVPVAKIVEILTGKAPDWNDATKTASFTYNGRSFRIDINQAGIYVDNVFRVSETYTPPIIVEGRTLIPLKMLTSAIGFRQEWDNTTRVVRLTTPVVTPAPTAPTPTTPPTPVQLPVTIHSATADKTSVQSGGEVTVTVATSSNANAVKIVDANNNMVEESRKYMAEGNKNTFKITFKPAASGRYQVYAGTSNTNYASGYQEIDLTVDTAKLEIYRVTPSNTAPVSGSTITISVETSTAANKIWLYNSLKSPSNFADTTTGYSDYGNTRTWTINYTVDMNYRQTYTVFATDSANREARMDFTLDINSTGSSSSVIRSVTASPTVLQSENNQWSEITVTTNASVSRLTFSLSGVGGLDTTSLEHYTQSGDQRFWKTGFYSTGETGTGRITVTAYDYNNRTATGDVSIFVGTSYGDAIIQDLYRTSGTVYAGSPITYRVTTGTDVYRLRIRVSNGPDFETNSFYESGGTRIWDIPSFPAGNSGNYVVTVEAYGSTYGGGVSDTRTDSYSVY